MLNTEISQIPLESSVSIEKGDALVVVDIQNDFLPGGALPVEKGDEIINDVNDLIEKFYFEERIIVFTQDWHPKNHQSFASQHTGKAPYDSFDAPPLGPVLWPDHCVQGTPGAEFASNLNVQRGHLIIRKGYHLNIDSYSTFIENDHVTSTGLEGYLRGLKVSRVFLCGLALDYCVFYSVIDAKTLGFEVMCIIDLTRPVGAPEDSISNALQKMVENNVLFTSNSKILG
ncbi:MAG: bifunctional nicotinamidase/pyrazinamidase [Promethearchaeota archaeon]